MDRILELRTTEIAPGDNDRRSFDREALEELARSIAENGLAQPITVRPLQDAQGHRYQIVAGERRWRAVAEVLGRETIPAVVKDLDDLQASSIMLAENMARADLDPIEEAEAYRKRMRLFGWDQTEVANVAGVSCDTVMRRLALLDLAPDIQALIQHGQLPLAHADALVKLDRNRQRIALRVFSGTNEMPIGDFRAMCMELLEEQSQEALFDIQDFWLPQEEPEDYHKNGRLARIYGPPADPDFPEPEYLSGRPTGHTVYLYMQALWDRGFRREASAVRLLFETLVRHRRLSVPAWAAEADFPNA